MFNWLEASDGEEHALIMMLLELTGLITGLPSGAASTPTSREGF